MKVKLNRKEIDFLKDILKDIEFFELISDFVENEEIEIDDDIADEIRDLCCNEEVSEVYNAEELKISITERGKIACNLVDKLYQE